MLIMLLCFRNVHSVTGHRMVLISKYLHWAALYNLTMHVDYIFFLFINYLSSGCFKENKHDNVSVMIAFYYYYYYY